MNSKEKLRCRKTKQVLRFHIPNKNISLEKYSHYLLFLYYPFRLEKDLLYNNNYHEKLSQPNVLEIVNLNRNLFEPYAEQVESALSYCE